MIGVDGLGRSSCGVCNMYKLVRRFMSRLQVYVFLLFWFFLFLKPDECLTLCCVDAGVAG